MTKPKTSAVFITNIPVPYREKIHEIVSNQIENYTVIYCQEREPNRHWDMQLGSYKKHFLSKSFIQYKDRYIHFNLDILPTLLRLKPDVVITTGFNPTFLIAFIWAMLFRKIHICFTDGWLGSEAELSAIHRLVRKTVFAGSSAFVGASSHSLRLYKAYGIQATKLFRSHLCADNERYAVSRGSNKKYDLIFSGQFIDRKCPDFFAQVATKVKRLRGECRVLLMGSGPLKEQTTSHLEEAGVAWHDAGFVSQDDLPRFYSQGKILLFPTKNDPWGVVANEALAVGVPVITCREAGVSDDLVLHGETGYILPLDADAWAQFAANLLNQEDLYSSMSERAFAHVQAYNFQAAANGIIDAIKHAQDTNG